MAHDRYIDSDLKNEPNFKDFLKGHNYNQNKN